jgi:ligand-binding sensor domain-containing protein
MDMGLAGRENFRPVRAIALAPDGSIWATHGYDLWRFGGSITMSPMKVPDPTCQIEHLQVDGVGNVWGTSAHCGMWQFIPSANSGEWVHHNPDGPISSIVLSTSGDLYAAGDAGLFLFPVTPSQGPTGKASLPWHWVNPSPRGNHVIAADQRNGVWIGSPKTGALWHYLGGDWIPVGDIFEKTRLNYLYVDSRDQLWANIGQALMVNDSSTWHTITLPIAMTGRKLTSGSDGRIWIIGDEGVAVYNPAVDKWP